MKKYLVLDLDGTVAPIGRAASGVTARRLRRAERDGVQIVFCSGKPTYYLTGFARQLGLRDPILIGENGAQTVFGIGLPPRKLLCLPVKKETLDLLGELKAEMEKRLGRAVWFQPNLIALTPFPAERRGFEIIAEILEKRKERIKSARLCVYPQCDCCDILPPGIDKGEALRALMKEEGADQSAFVSIGDGINDLTMLKACGYSIGIGRHLEGYADITVNNIGKALDTALDRLVTTSGKE